MDIQMKPVSSSNIGAVGYDEDEKRLVVEFAKNGQRYEYRGVPKRLYDEMLAAESVGSFFASKIRNDFPYSKL